ncbi:MAG: hypothetical protein JOY71_04110 [Acetobacteraceae bacterium]|nr:hypothetical protein [Acetobacteraceae bacterium]MBV8589869.1 hypothetical protein [Acetobacteraceae bacterium]
MQNTKKNERLTFSVLRPWPGGRVVSAEGIYEENGERKRAAIVIGPEYGTVGIDLVREAAREARDLFDTLVICAFAFDPHVGEGTMNLGRLTVLKARMSQELHAAEAYKAGGGNLFVVFGEPDIGLDRTGDGQFRVTLKGVDIFDPNTGNVRSSNKLEDDIACWFIDTDYDGDFCSSRLFPRRQGSIREAESSAEGRNRSGCLGDPLFVPEPPISAAEIGPDRG